jgi:hypothetical protein
MNKTARVTIAVLALLLLIAGTAFAVKNPVALEHRSPVAASHDPQPSASADASEPADEPGDEANDASDGPPSADLVAKVLQRLSDAGIDTDAGTLSGLIDAYGVGGAVRLLAWSDASGTALADLQALRDGGMGWGQIARQLNDADDSLHLSPGIGSIMSGGHAQGHDKAADATDAASDGKVNGRDSAPGQAPH